MLPGRCLTASESREVPHDSLLVRPRCPSPPEPQRSGAVRSRIATGSGRSPEIPRTAFDHRQRHRGCPSLRPSRSDSAPIPLERRQRLTPHKPGLGVGSTAIRHTLVPAGPSLPGDGRRIRSTHAQPLTRKVYPPRASSDSHRGTPKRCRITANHSRRVWSRLVRRSLGGALRTVKRLGARPTISLDTPNRPASAPKARTGVGKKRGDGAPRGREHRGRRDWIGGAFRRGGSPMRYFGSFGLRPWTVSRANSTPRRSGCHRAPKCGQGRTPEKRLRVAAQPPPFLESRESGGTANYLKMAKRQQFWRSGSPPQPGAYRSGGGKCGRRDRRPRRMRPKCSPAPARTGFLSVSSRGGRSPATASVASPPWVRRHPSPGRMALWTSDHDGPIWVLIMVRRPQPRPKRKPSRYPSS